MKHGPFSAQPVVTVRTTRDYLYAFTLTTLAGLSTAIGGWLAVWLARTSPDLVAPPSSVYGGEMSRFRSAMHRVLAFLFDVDFKTWIRKLSAGEYPIASSRPRSTSMSHDGHSHGLPEVENSSPYAYLVLGACQAAAGGIMIAVCVVDLIPVAIREIGVTNLLIWSIVGTLAFVLVIALIPEPDLSNFIPSSTLDPDEEHVDHEKGHAASVSLLSSANAIEEEEEEEEDPENQRKTNRDQLSAGICAALSNSSAKSTPPLASQLSTGRKDGAAGDPSRHNGSHQGYGTDGAVHVQVSESQAQVSQHSHHHPAASSRSSRAERLRMFYSGLVIAIGLALHNLPEGMAVCMMSMKDFTIGIPLAAAIALHNIPEGLAISLPVYHATQSAYRAIGLSLLSGLAEPLGVIFVFLFFHSQISQLVIARMLACVAGAMLYLSFKELLPVGVQYIGLRSTIKFAVLGGILMTIFMLVLPHSD